MEIIIITGNSVNIIISKTTRDKRVGEADGVDYDFVSPAEMAILKRDRTTIAISKNPAGEYCVDGFDFNINKPNILILDPAGAAEIKRNFTRSKIIVIQISVPVMEWVRRNMEKITKDLGAFVSRYMFDIEMFANAYRDYDLMNDSTLEDLFNEAVEIINKEYFIEEDIYNVG